MAASPENVIDVVDAKLPFDVADDINTGTLRSEYGVYFRKFGVVQLRFVLFFVCVRHVHVNMHGNVSTCRRVSFHRFCFHPYDDVDDLCV